MSKQRHHVEKTSDGVSKRPGDGQTKAYRKRVSGRRPHRKEIWWMNNQTVEAEYMAELTQSEFNK